MKALDLSNQTFGRLRVISRAPSATGLSKWTCVCACGKSHVAIGKLLKKGQVKSCGCLRHDTKTSLRHGHSLRSGMSRTYRAWARMRQRCTNPNNKDFSNYGARGITVCDRWRTFDSFLADLGDCPDKFEIDRIDCNGNYEPGNVRWTDEKTQALNRNWTLWVTIDKQRMPMKEAASVLGLSYSSLKALTAKGGKHRLSADDAIGRLLAARRA